MIKEELLDLLSEIHVIYPSFKGPNNSDEMDILWKRLKNVSYQRAISVLDSWMDSESGKFAPPISIFTVLAEPEIKYVVDNKAHDYTEEDGHIYDEEGREYIRQ